MAKKMLIDATHAEESRVVVVDGNKVEEFDFETVNKRQLQGNIYLAKVTRVEPSLQAAFVDYGGNRHGFLAFAEIHPDYYQIPVADRQALLAEERASAEAMDAEETRSPRRRKPSHRAEGVADAAAVTTSDDIPGMAVVDLDAEHGDGDETDTGPTPRPSADAAGQDRGPADEPYVAADHASATDDDIESIAEEDVAEEIRQPRKPRPRRYKIQEVVKVRQIMLVQVVKEERGNKGAALTTYLSLAGRYCVLMPNTARGGGISRKITNAADRKKLKEIAGEIEVPDGAGLIIRTAGSQRTKTEIRRDYEYLMRLWEQIRDLTLRSIAPAPIYEEGDLIKRSIRDLYNKDIDEVLVEGEKGYRAAKDFMKMIMPSHARNVQLYQEPLPLFARYQVESYLGGMFNPVVQLKSGGYIVIGVTEALVAIDVNSGRATKEGSIEDTALKTNLEASEEIARQLRLRDLAGLIVIDFIDMEERKNNAAVEKRLKEKLKTDRARIQVGRISGFGLLEMSRQRLRPGMIESTTQPCPHCHGTGHIRGTESSALHILRILQEEAMKENTGAIHVQLPVDVATFLLNEKRVDIHTLESRLKVNVVMIPNIHMETPNYTLTRLRHDELNQNGAAEPSYKMTAVPETETVYQTAQAAAPARQEAAVKSIAPPPQPAPVAVAQPVVPVAVPAQGGLFERIFGWFKKRGDEAYSETAAEVVASPTAPARSERNGERRERKSGQRRGRGEGRSSEARGETRSVDTRDGDKRETRASEGRNETRPTEVREPKQPRPPRQPKQSRPEADAAQPALEVVSAPPETAGEEKREPRNRRGRGRRGRGEGRSENGNGTVTPHAIIETAGYRAVIEIARPARPAVEQAAPAQQALQLEAATPAPLTGAVTATPASVLAQLAAGSSDLQQVETQDAATASAASSDTEPGRPRRRRRPSVKSETEPVSLQQVETSTPVSAAAAEAPATSPAPHPTRRRTRPQVAVAQEPLVQVETHSN